MLQRAAALGTEGVSVLFGLSSIQIKSDVFAAKFTEAIAILPGLAFQG